jgi:hypothetical protein
MLNLSNFLTYGAIGLGLALALLSFRLLALEQKIAKPRSEILRAAYVFMAFALILAGAGFASEWLKADVLEGRQAASSLAALTAQYTALEKEKIQADAAGRYVKRSIQDLTDAKAGYLSAIRQPPECEALVNEVRQVLLPIDETLRKVFE